MIKETAQEGKIAFKFSIRCLVESTKKTNAFTYSSYFAKSYYRHQRNFAVLILHPQKNLKRMSIVICVHQHATIKSTESDDFLTRFQNGPITYGMAQKYFD